jgi:hypothetical protein
MITGGESPETRTRRHIKTLRENSSTGLGGKPESTRQSQRTCMSTKRSLAMMLTLHCKNIAQKHKLCIEFLEIYNEGFSASDLLVVLHVMGFTRQPPGSHHRTQGRLNNLYILPARSHMCTVLGWDATSSASSSSSSSSSSASSSSSSSCLCDVYAMI